MKVRAALAHECDVLSDIAGASKAHWGYSPEDLARWASELVISEDSIAQRPTFLAEADHVAVGFFQLSETGNGIEIDHFWVAPEFMGRGVGRVLLECAAAEARALGYSNLEIDADPNAKAFYLACGAIDTGKFIAAPTASDPDRVRPQLLLSLR